MMENVQRLNEMVRVSFNGLEDRVMKLFREIKKRKQVKERTERSKTLVKRK